MSPVLKNCYGSFPRAQARIYAEAYRDVYNDYGAFAETEKVGGRLHSTGELKRNDDGSSYESVKAAGRKEG